MEKQSEQLFAIFKNGEHMGNERGKNGAEAINAYVIASQLSEFLYDLDFMKMYSAEIAINGIHHHFIDYQN